MKKVLVDRELNSEYILLLIDILNDSEIETVTFKNYKKDKYDLILLTGGTDVNPELYGEKRNSLTDLPDTDRDNETFKFLSSIQLVHIPRLGICRGAQLLCVDAGGKIIQHVEGHNRDHRMTVQYNQYETTDITITSDHHQMMYPFDTKHKILGWSTKYLSNVYLNGDNKQIKLNDKFLEPEIVYFPNKNSLSIQGHPEYLRMDQYDRKLIVNLIKKTLDL